jgi:membrane-associated phospholipid phosphatase
MTQKTPQNWQDTIWQTVVQISSFPGFALPIALYALMVQDVSTIFAFLISLFVLAIGHLILKAILRTPRPAWYKKDHVLFPAVVDGSFPSNHTWWAFLLYFFVQATIPPLNFLFLFFAVLVAVSRLQLHKHHPIDVVGGFITAYVVFFFAVYVVGILG